MAASLLSTACVLVVPTLRWISLEQRAAAQRQIAAFEADNLMERLTALDWEDLVPEKTDAWKLSDETARQLSDPRLSIRITVVPGEPAAKRIAVAVAWKTHSGTQVAPVRVDAWVYRTRRGA